MAFGLFNADGSRSLLANISALGVITVIVGVGAAQWLAERAEKQALAARSGRVIHSQNVRSVLDDPLTTGSIARAAGATRLDPCAAPGRNR